MWIEVKSMKKRLINLDHISDVILDKNCVRYYGVVDYADGYNEESFTSEEEAQARYEEIKKMLVPQKEEVIKLPPNVEKAYQEANNVIYFNDSSDYLNALYYVCKCLKPDLEPGVKCLGIEED